nr:glycosyltransferase [Nocardia takedensis]
MKALLAFGGSRGDAQPGILLARELIDRGHRVTLAVSPNLVEFACGHGIPAIAFGLDTNDLLRAQFDSGPAGGPLRRLRRLRDLNRQGFTESAEELLGAFDGTELVVAAMAGEEVGRAVAAVGFASVHFFPIHPNRSVPIVPTAWGSAVPGQVNRVGWAAAGRARAWALAPDVAALCAREPGAARRPAEIALHAYDRRLFGPLSLEWDAARPFVGFLVPTEMTRPDDDTELDEWLAAGPPPVYAGFGSMPVGDVDAVIALLRSACLHLGRRLLFVGAAPSRTTSDLAVRAAVSHSWVLPRAPWRCTTAARGPSRPPCAPESPRWSARSWPINPTGGDAWKPWEPVSHCRSPGSPRPGRGSC